MINDKEAGYEYDVAICLDTVKAIQFFFVGGHHIVVSKDMLYSMLFSQRTKQENQSFLGQGGNKTRKE